jgi:hypothetical protein
MPTIKDRLRGLKENWFYKKRLERIQQEASANPQNLVFQVWLGDFLAKVNSTKEAVDVYERAAQEFI